MCFVDPYLIQHFSQFYPYMDMLMPGLMSPRISMPIRESHLVVIILLNLVPRHRCSSCVVRGLSTVLLVHISPLYPLSVASIDVKTTLRDRAENRCLLHKPGETSGVAAGVKPDYVSEAAVEVVTTWDLGHLVRAREMLM